MKLVLISIVTTIIYCVSIRASILKVAPELINEQVNFLERVILMSEVLAKESPHLSNYTHIDQQKLLLHKCFSMLDVQVNYFLKKTNDVKRGLIDLLFQQGTDKAEETTKTLERESIALGLEMKQFFFHDLRNQYNVVGKGMNMTDDELEKNFKIATAMFAENLMGSA